MARATIKQRISLEGGRELQDQLKALGTEGEKAFEKIRAAALKADLAKFGDSLNRFGGDIATVGRRLSLAFAAMATAAAGAAVAVVGLAKAGAEQADASLKAAQAAGLQIDAYGRLSFAADQAGVDASSFGTAMNRLNAAIADAAAAGAKSTKKLGDAAKSSGRVISEEFGRQVSVYDDAGVTVTRFGETYQKTTKKTADEAKGAAAVFAQLGVAIRDASGRLRGNEEILADLADAFARLPDGAEKSALAIELFGRSGTVLLPFLNAGSKGMRELGLQAERLGIVFTREQGVVAEAMNDTLAEVRQAANGIRFQLGLLFAPAITSAAAEFRDLLIDNRQAIVEFGRSVALNGVMVVRDLINALRGNDAAVRNVWILEWRYAFVTFGRDARAVVETVVLPAIRAVRDGAQVVANAINAIFGSNLTGGQVLIAATLLRLLGVFRAVGSAAGVVVAAIRLLGSALAYAFAPGAIAGLVKVGTFFAGLVRGAAAFIPLIGAIVGWPALLVAGVVAAGTALFVFWDDIVAGAQGAIEAVRDFFSAENFAGVLSGITAAAGQAGALLVDAFAAAFVAIGGLLQANLALVSGFFTGIVTRAAALAAELLPTWEQITTAAGTVWTTFSTRAGEVFGIVVDQVAALGGFLQPYWDAIALAAGTVWTGLQTAVSGTVAFIVEAFTGAVSTITTVVAGIATATLEAFTGATSEVVQAADAIGAAIRRATEIAGDVEGAGELAAALVAPFVDASGQIEQVMAGINSIAAAGFGAVSETVRRMGNEIRAEIDRILAALRAAAAAAARLRSSASSSGGGDADGFAGGGLLSGPGTSTSDSIPIWGSVGEFMMRARAVQYYGTDFFRALNGLRLPRDMFKGFSLGGLIGGIEAQMSSVRVPRMAMGGPVPALAGASSDRPVHLSLVGEKFSRAEVENLVGTLVQELTGRSLRKAGRSPGWVGA